MIVHGEVYLCKDSNRLIKIYLRVKGERAIIVIPVVII